jgi:UDP-glucose 4-epimerase
VYGASPVLPLRESDIPHPEDPYGVAKLAVEQDLLACNRMFGMDHVIFRPHNVYGERQNIGDRYRNVVGIFMNQILQGKPMTIFGDGSQTRAFSYIGDQIFNIGADQPYTVNELAKAIARAM